jgi:long-chain acyl-CoA synthetase
MERIWNKSYAKGVPPSLSYNDIPLHQALSLTAKKYPENVALIFEGTQITFRELDDMVSRFAGALKGLGIRPGGKVSIILPNLIQTAVAIYGTLRVGAIAVMHNPRNDDMLMEYQLNVAGSETVVCLDVLVPKLEAIQKRTSVRTIISCHIRDYLPFLKKQLFPFVKKQLHLRTREKEGLLEFTHFMDSGQPVIGSHVPSMDDTAFILFTSATTGKSKGVELSHRNMSRNVQQVRAWFPVFRDGKEVVVGCLPFFHVFGLTCSLNIGIFCAFTDILIPLPDPTKILEAVSQYQATFIPALPILYTGMINDSNLSKHNLTSLKGCFSGGAPLALEIMKTFEKLTGGQICEGYGLTECSPVSHVNPFGGKTKIGTIGLPLPDTDIKLVDVDDFGIEITSPGERGELCIKGPQVMKGYVNLEHETRATLRDGWLLTGDIAVMDAEGYFSIVDRKKEIIVSSGEKIFPRDIDEVLFAHPKIMEACALGVPDRELGQIVKAYIVIKKGEKLTSEDVIDHCQKHLSPENVPRLVEFLQELPRSQVGKVLRKELKRMHLVQSSLGAVKSTTKPVLS